MDMDTFLVALGRSIRALRVKRGWSREQLADAADVGVKQLGKIERGEGRGQLVEIWRIADALEIDTSELVADAEAEARRSG